MHFQLLGEDASALCQRTVTVPFVHLEELALGELLQVAPVLKSGEVLEDDVILSVAQVH